jgi:hypothetical protein
VRQSRGLDCRAAAAVALIVFFAITKNITHQKIWNLTPAARIAIAEILGKIKTKNDFFFTQRIQHRR